VADGEREALDWTFQPRVTVRSQAVRIAFTYLSTVVPRQAFSYPAHRHVAYELIVPDRGIYRCRINDVALAAKPGQVVVIQPGDLHQDELRRGQRYRGVGMHLIWPEGWTGRLLSPGLSAPAQVATTAVADVLAALAEECERCDAIAASRQDVLAAELLWRTVRGLPAASLAAGTGEHSGFIAAVERLFRCHAAQRLPVEAMARSLGMGVTACTAAFRRHLGLSPARAFARWRVGEARRLLAHGDLSVTAVAAHLGFANPYHFARVVRRHAGLPPSRLR
jgi:AraC-like DNA-binding protein